MTVALTRPAASAAVHDLGWRYLLGTFRCYVAVPSTAAALEVAGTALAACGAECDARLAVDIRADRVELGLADPGTGQVTARDAELARGITAALDERGYRTTAVADEGPRGVQLLEIAVDALDIPAVRPFWKAVLAYEDEPGGDGVVDPLRQGPAVWFQQMDAPRPQRNRIHFDLTVPHDEAQARVQAALDAGGVLVSDAAARSFWIVADREGNEVCVCTWQDRD